MDLSWIGSISTGMVGLAGIAGTVWTARQGRTSERRRTQIQLLRTEYVSYLKVVESAIDLQNKIMHDLSHWGPTKHEKPEMHRATDAKRIELLEHVVRLRLCAPHPIVDQAEHLSRVIGSMYDQTMAEGALLDEYQEAQRELTTAMRDDLDRRERAA